MATRESFEEAEVRLARQAPMVVIDRANNRAEIRWRPGVTTYGKLSSPQMRRSLKAIRARFGRSAFQTSSAKRDPQRYAREWLWEMSDMLKRAGYERPEENANKLFDEGMGPEELRERLYGKYNLEYTHGLKRRRSS